MQHQLAQMNVAKMRGPLDSEVMREFAAWLEPLNAIADTSPGFVWRLQDEAGDATSIRAFDDPLLLVNMSVWASLEALRAYVYGGDHARALRLRAGWFHRLTHPSTVLWWVPAGHRPSVDEGKKRLALLHERGPTSDAFTFTHTFPAPR